MNSYKTTLFIEEKVKIVVTFKLVFIFHPIMKKDKISSW